jgi:hypothetical protein
MGFDSPVVNHEQSYRDERSESRAEERTERSEVSDESFW